MPGPITLKFFNSSATLLNLSGSYTGYGVEKGIGSLSTQPSQTLMAGAGSTTMEMDENALSNIVGGYAWINCGWVNPATDYHFGVKIYMPVQVLHMGDRPYYQIAQNTQANDPPWTTPVDDPSKPYTFSPQHDFKIVCTPTSGHTSLVVSVQISNP